MIWGSSLAITTSATRKMGVPLEVFGFLAGTTVSSQAQDAERGDSSSFSIKKIIRNKHSCQQWR